ncbi:MAG: DNA replication and repair protein RecF [Bacteroidetes bacterium]|nr:MAG: DNA replication and repair protein RecF [Bacteroidota bacterium]
MFLKSVNITNFKNIETAKLNFSEKLNCFTGNNGSGKTNLLDAVHYLSFTKSYFNTSDAQIIKHNNNFFVLQGEYIRNTLQEKIYCGYEKDKKKIIKRNDNNYKRFSEHIGLLPVVTVSPNDGILITGTGEERRKYIDSVISQYDKEYLYELIKYNKILSQRNRLLKNYVSSHYFDADTIDIYNEQLSESGTKIHQKRKTFITELIPIFTEYYETVSNKNENVSLEYISHLNESDFLHLLHHNIDKDKILGYTGKGIHRDDITLNINGLQLKKAGSQGQQKTFLIALKFAQFQFIKNISKINPLLLLDDIFDKFDAERVTQIIKLTNNNFGQIFITDTNPERVKKVIDSEKGNFKLFHTEKGKFTEK